MTIITSLPGFLTIAKEFYLAVPREASNEPGIWHLHVTEGKLDTGANVTIEFPYLSLKETHMLDAYGSIKLQLPCKAFIFKLN